MISILMPLYNGLEFLSDSISSIQKQSYKEWELLIGINGYSREKYEMISVQINELNDERIKIFYGPKGKVKTLNMLVTRAKNDIICLIDVDDYWFPEKISKQLVFIEKYDVIGADCAYFGGAIGTPGLFLGKLNHKMFSYQNPIVNSSVMMKIENAVWEEAWEGLDDYNLWLHLIDKQKTFYNVPEILVNHRIHKASYYNNINEDLHKKLLDEKVPKLTDDEHIELSEMLVNNKWEL